MSRWLCSLFVALTLLVSGRATEAAIFGVPTNMAADGRVCLGNNNPAGSGCTVTSVNPPGFFLLSGTASANTDGDTAHQLRLFIEVTGTTLDIKIFDPGNSGARDLVRGSDSETTYQLLSPTSGLVQQIANFDNDSAATTQDRLARFSSTGAFTAANAGTTFTGLSAGLYELRVTMVSGEDDINAFGVDIRDGSGNHYNVYTFGESSAPDTAMLAGSLTGGTAPLASITQPMVFFPYVNRGCSVQTSNYDMDSASAAGSGSDATLTDSAGGATILTMSGDAARAQDVVTVESTVGGNLESTNYGLYTLTNDTGSQDNRIIDWRVADFQGWNAFAAGLPADPVSAIRTYLPNGYAPATGNPGAVAPVEPILAGSTRVVTGTNPPVAGQPTTFVITGSVFNPTGSALSAVQITVPIVPGGVYIAGSQQGCIDGVGPIGSGCPSESAAAPACVDGSSGAFRRCTFASLAAGSVASLNIQVQITPTLANSSFLVTGQSAAGGPPPNTTLWAQYTPAFSSVAFPRTETLGPACELVVFSTARVDLAVTQTDAPDPVSAGSNLTYTITMTNGGPNEAPTATLNDTIPAGTTFQSVTAPAGWSCTAPPVGSSGSVSCINTANLPVATPAVLTLVVRVAETAAPGSTLTNTATVTSTGNEQNPANNTSSVTTTVVTRADLSVTKSDSPDPVLAGQDITYTAVLTNNGPSAAVSPIISDTVPANTTYRGGQFPAGWTCAIPPIGGTGPASCTAASLPAGTSLTFTMIVRVNPGVAVGTVIGNTASVSTATTDPVAANNTTSISTTVAAPPTSPPCATPGDYGPGGVLAGVINRYYPGTATAAAGATSISVGTATGGATPIAAGDLLLVVQMQDAAINSTNTGAYGDGTAGDPARGSTSLNNAGIYEFVRATGPVAAGAVPIFGTGTGSGLINTFTNATATAAQGQRRFQVIRVPQYSSATLGPTLTAGRWNGTTGGILVFDVAGNLSLGSTTVNVTGRGFRGAGARQLAGGAGTGTDYRNAAASAVHGMKAEGVAGTPRFVYNEATAAVDDLTTDGYPNGSSARGGPGNAGGGGTDSNPSANDENSGGGGGGNGGIGGQGGNAWQSVAAVGGFGGAARPGPATNASRFFLGGGGGAGTRNNSSGVMSSGGAGGAMVLFRAGTVSGTGTITADGSPGIAPLNDGGGGGGAGGTVAVLVLGGGLGGLTVNARGGRGSDAWPTEPPNGTPGERHGPGGGGAGGVVLLSSAAAATTVTGGANGITTTANDAFGATPGGIGTVSTSLTSLLGAGCSANLSITKTDSPDPALLGQNVTYTIVATNLGSLTATGVAVVDTLPAGVTFVSANPSQGMCTQAAGIITCSVGNLASGASVVITVVITPTGVGSILNSASVAATEFDPDTTNNLATATTTVSGAADLAVTITDAPDPVEPAQSLTYSVGVRNNGPSTAVGATLTLPVPANTTFQSISVPAGWNCTTPAVGGTGTVVCTLASMVSGASANFSIGVLVNASTASGTVLSATAAVSSTTADSVSTNNTATALTPVATTVVLTRATLRGLRVSPEGMVEFATGSQRGTASFNLYAVNDARGEGERVLLNATPILAPVADSMTPVLYEARTLPITAPYLLIEETDQRGRRFLGPFRVDDRRLRRAYERIEARLRDAGLREAAPRFEGRARTLPPGAAVARFAGRSERAAERAAATGQLAMRKEAREGQGIKVEVSRAGVIRLFRTELEERGLPPGTPLTTLRVTSQGESVPFRVLDPGTGVEALAFRTETLSTTYTGRNVYVITSSGGRPRTSVTLTREADPLPSGFTRAERNQIYVSNAPLQTDPWVWDLLVGDGSAWPYDGDPQPGVFDLPGLVAGSGDVAVRIRVFGRTHHRHSVDAVINGVSVGSLTFEGAVPALLEGRVPSAALRAAGNTLSLTYFSDASDDGEPGLLYLDYADLGAPVERIDELISPDAITTFDSRLPSTDGADYLIVTHPLFASQAARIAELKAIAGHRAVVVDVERIYDRFSAGVVEAEAIHALLQQVFASRQGRLKYVLLVGDDTFDYRDFTGLAPAGILPSLLGWDGEFGRIPAENRTADLDGDGQPDLAIGRLPVQTVEQAEILVDKITRQDAVVRGNLGRHVFAVDNQAPGEPSFRNQAQQVAAQLPAGASTTWADVGEGIDGARERLLGSLREGAAFTHYFGHGGPELWADESLLTVEDIVGLTGPETVALTWACESQWFQYLFGNTVGEALVLQPRGGALASFGPAGIADAHTHALLYEQLYRELKNPKVTLGEAIRRAKAAAIAKDPRSRPVVEGWNLLGDPALRPFGLAPAR